MRDDIKGMITGASLMLCLILFFLVSCGEKRNNDLLAKAEAMESIGELDSSIVLLRTFIIKNPKHWDSRLNIARLYHEVGDFDRENIVYDRIMLSDEAPDSVFEDAWRHYTRLLSDEYKKTLKQVDSAIKMRNLETIDQFSTALWKIVGSFKKYLVDIDSRDLPYLNLSGLSRDDYKQALVVLTVAYKLFSISDDKYFKGELYLTYNNPPDQYVRERWDNSGLLSTSEIVKNELNEALGTKFQEFGSYYFDQEEWEFAGRCYGFGKDYALKLAGGWSYWATQSAYNEAVAYKNNKEYHESLRLLKSLLSNVPNVDEQMQAFGKRTHETLQKIDPTIGAYEPDKLKSVSQVITDLELLIRY